MHFRQFRHSFKLGFNSLLLEGAEARKDAKTDLNIQFKGEVNKMSLELEHNLNELKTRLEHLRSYL